jgi:protein-S-isoprenylcysteine O-methyltransferase Ste14
LFSEENIINREESRMKCLGKCAIFNLEKSLKDEMYEDTILKTKLNNIRADFTILITNSHLSVALFHQHRRMEFTFLNSYVIWGFAPSAVRMRHLSDISILYCMFIWHGDNKSIDNCSVKRTSSIEKNLAWNVWANVRVPQSLGLRVMFCGSLFVLSHLAIVLSVLRITASDYHYGIFIHFVLQWFLKIKNSTFAQTFHARFLTQIIE